jgi:hypothetical protein
LVVDLSFQFPGLSRTQHVRVQVLLPIWWLGKAIETSKIDRTRLASWADQFQPQGLEPCFYSELAPWGLNDRLPTYFLLVCKCGKSTVSQNEQRVANGPWSNVYRLYSPNEITCVLNVLNGVTTPPQRDVRTWIAGTQ